MRKAPIRHKVRSHTRQGRRVNSYMRGHGTKSSVSPRRGIKAMEIPKLERIKVGRPSKAKKPGSPISYLLANGKRAHGTVIKSFKGYYLVEQDRTHKIHRVNKGSIFYKIGGAIGKVLGTVRGTLTAMKGEYKTEREAVKEFIEARRRRRLAEVRRI